MTPKVKFVGLSTNKTLKIRYTPKFDVYIHKNLAPDFKEFIYSCTDGSKILFEGKREPFLADLQLYINTRISEGKPLKYWVRVDTIEFLKNLYSPESMILGGNETEILQSALNEIFNLAIEYTSAEELFGDLLSDVIL